MSNTKDTPMDYKHEECSKALRCLYIAVDEAVAADVDNKVSAYVHELKLELQKQKELNASYAKEFALTILNDLKDQLYQVITVDIHEVEVREIQEIINKYNLTDESLIKKSSEV